MKPNELQKLRDWSAEVLMGWREGLKDFWIIAENCSGQHAIEVMEKKNWQPDTDLNQSFLLVEKMREDGWNFNLNGQGRIATRDYIPQFHRIDNPTKHGMARNPNPALAILLAAKATEVEPCGISGSE